MKKTYQYAIACPTSMGVRITPPERMAVQNSNLFYMQATSAETNVLNVASSLGRECLALTKFVKGSPVADFIKRQLRARNIRFEGIEVEQGGRGAIGTNLMLRTPASACAHRVSGMTVLVKLVGHFLSKILTWSASSVRRASESCTCPASSRL